MDPWLNALSAGETVLWLHSLSRGVPLDTRFVPALESR